MQYEEFRTQLLLDPKGRLTLPVQLREELRSQGVDRLVGIAANGALWLFAPEDYRTIIKGRVRGQDPFARPTSNYIQAVISTNQTLPLDNAGRVLLPAHLRELAGLERDVVVFSSLEWIEVWDKARWEARFSRALREWDQGSDDVG